MPTIKRPEELFVEYLEINSIEILQENIQNHENDMQNNAFTFV